MDSAAIRRTKAREVGPEVHLPYLRHASEHVLTLSTGALITCIRLEGISFETADPADLNELHAKLNLTLRNIADERLALWTHVIRRRVHEYPCGTLPVGLCTSARCGLPGAPDGAGPLRQRAHADSRLASGTGSHRTCRRLSSPVSAARAVAAAAVDSASLKKLEDATRDAVAALAAYGPRRLGFEDRDGIAFSEPTAFLHELVSGECLPMPLVQGPIGPALYTNRLIFGREAVEIRSPGRSTYAGLFGLKEYPATTKPGLLDGLLAAPMELVVTQSFAFLAKHEAKAVMTRKQNQLLSANDPAASQIGDLSLALDDLESGRFVMGDHHLSVLVRAESPEALLDNMAQARRVLADAGAVVAREDLGLEAAYWAQLPGQFRYRARAGRHHLAQLRGAFALPHLSLGSKRRKPLGSGGCLLQDGLGRPLSFLLPRRRSRQHLRLRTLGIRQDRLHRPSRWLKPKSSGRSSFSSTRTAAPRSRSAPSAAPISPCEAGLRPAALR